MPGRFATAQVGLTGIGKAFVSFRTFTGDGCRHFGCLQQPGIATIAVGSIVMPAINVHIEVMCPGPVAQLRISN